MIYFSFCFRTQCEAGRGWWQAREAYPEIPPGLRARLTFDRTAAAWQHAAAPSADSAGQSQINVLTSRECLSLKVDTRRFDRAEAGGKKVNRWVVERAHSWHHFLPPLSVYLCTGSGKQVRLRVDWVAKLSSFADGESQSTLMAPWEGVVFNKLCQGIMNMWGVIIVVVHIVTVQTKLWNPLGKGDGPLSFQI